MKKLIYLLLFFPLLATAQINGTIQKTVATGIVRGSFGSSGIDTLPPVTGVLTNGYLLAYNSTSKKWYALNPATIAPDSTVFQTVSNFFPKGDTRYAKSNVANKSGNLYLERDASNSIHYPSEMSTIMRGDSAIVFYTNPTSGPLQRAVAFDPLCKTFGTPIVSLADSLRFPYVTISGSTLYLIAQKYVGGLADKKFYMWSSANYGLSWTALNGGSAVFTNSASPASIYYEPTNPGIYIDGTTVHLWMETGQTQADPEQFGISYTYAPLASLTDFNTNKTANWLIPRGGQPQPILVPDRGAVILLHGIFTDLWEIKAKTVSSSFSSATSYKDAPYFRISSPTIHITDPDFFVAGGTKTHNIIIRDLYNQNTTSAYYSDLSLTAFYDRITAEPLTGNLATLEGVETLTNKTISTGSTYNGGAVTSSGAITGSTIVKSGGTSAQYLMADGSVSTLTNPITGTGTLNYLPKFSTTSTLGNSSIYDSGTKVGVFAVAPTFDMDLGDGTSKRIFNINGSASGSAGGTALFLSNGGSTLNAIGNHSTILGGAFNSDLLIFNGSSTNGQVKVYTNGAIALTIANNQAATFAGNISAPNLESVTYTPTLTNVANISSSTVGSFSYSRIGNQVTVYGVVTITITSAEVTTQLGITLPVASNFTSSQEARGHGVNSGTGQQGVYIISDSTNDRAILRLSPISGGVQEFYFSFQYTVL